MIRQLHFGLCALLTLPLLGLSMPAQAAQPVADLLARIERGDANQRLDAIEALGETGDPAALRPLLDLLGGNARSGMERMAAATGLAGLGDARAVAPLIAALRRDMRQRTSITMAIIPALGALGDKRAVPILIEALTKREDRWLARETAATALGRIGDSRAVPHLVNAAWMADTRAAAIGALAQIKDPRGLEAMLSALQSDEEPAVRQSAAVGLIFLGAPAVLPLSKLLAQGGGEFDDPALRRRAIEILGAIGGERARTALAAATKDADSAVRMAARSALRRSRDD